MPNKKSFWLPLAIAAVLAFALGCVVEDRFGENLSSYVGAVSTLLLVAVTITYVIATQAMADTAREQLNLHRLEPTRQAIDAVHKAFARRASDLLTINLEAKTYATRAIQDPNVESRTRDQFLASVSRLGSFADALVENRHHLPQHVEDAAGDLHRFVQASQLAAQALDAATWAVVDATLSGGPKAGVGQVRALWEADVRTQTVHSPTWEQYVSDEWLDLMLERTVAFENEASRPSPP